MKYLTIFTSFLFLLVAACSSETQPPADQSGAQEEPEPTAQESGPPPAEVGDGSGETPQFVEESDADPEEDADVEKPIMLAQANPPDSSRDWKFEQGKHFFRFQSTQPVVGGPDKIEVAEIFWYGCAHCYDFEPHINQWADSAPENVRFVRIPATWNPLLELHAKLYYTEEVLVNNGKIENPEAFRAAVFNEYHQRRNRLTSEASIQTLFERHGVSADDFRNTWNSFEVSSKLNKAKDLAVRYGISGVPAVVVNGKYRTGSSNDVRGYPMLLEVVDELVARESS
ncbi:MAG: thiol:disulfide interchange protein DsbA/DsbL [Gammaproteobacteria bacterium]|nr:thiol:disulfide interchange protein DsbA/DsbL [Gammaproteobacteria bacterium]